VDAVRYVAKGIVIKLAEFFDRDQVRTLTGSTWYESREAFPELKADELYLVDLIGLDAVLDGGELIGPIVEIYDYGPYETLAIRRGGREVLVPYVDEFVSRIDLDRKTVVISPIEGLLDV